MNLFTFLSEFEQLTEGGLPVYDVTLRLGVAMLLGIAIGIERAQREQSAGMRTYAVVSMASALMMLVSIYGLPMVEGRPQDPGRIAAQVVSGIGFLGAGLIFMKRNIVHGLTTAASLWAVSGIGLAVGGGMIITGTIATLFLLLISGGLRPLKKRLFHHEQDEHKVRLYLSGSGDILRDLRDIASSDPGFTISSLDFETSRQKGESVIDLKVKVRDPDDAIVIMDQIKNLPEVDRIGWHVGNSG